MILKLSLSQSYQIDFVIDFHAHTSLNGAFIYGNTYEDVYRYERHLVFPKMLSTNTDDFAQPNVMFNADDRKAGSCRRFCCERLSDTVNSYTLEVSMCGYYLKGSEVLTQYTEDGCKSAGSLFSTVPPQINNRPHFQIRVSAEMWPVQFSNIIASQMS